MERRNLSASGSKKRGVRVMTRRDTRMARKGRIIEESFIYGKQRKTSRKQKPLNVISNLNGLLSIKNDDVLILGGNENYIIKCKKDNGFLCYVCTDNMGTIICEQQGCIRHFCKGCVGWDKFGNRPTVNCSEHNCHHTFQREDQKFKMETSDGVMKLIPI